MAHGGKRPGAGRKPSQPVLDKLQARELARKMITAHLEPLIEAQVAHARGLKYLVVRDKRTGKFIRVTQAMAREKQGNNEDLVEIWEKDPSTQAFTDLMNRALDKPAEPAQTLDISGALEVHWKAVK